uniref:FAM194 C-terminal domain-containing protein n=1 Tax=Knipowitschia caucasica TaxID=637954 RepID=A0AAV2KFY6_KNICA
MPSYFSRTAGILKYVRESEAGDLTFVTQPENQTAYVIKCEHCGEEMSPSLEEMYLFDAETEIKYCCDKWQQLHMLLVNMTNIWDNCQVPQDVTAPSNVNFKRENNQLLNSAKEVNLESNKFGDFMFEVPIFDNDPQGANVRCFRLSRPKHGSWVRLHKIDERTPFRESNLNPHEISAPPCEHKPLEFGLCHHQDGFVDKYYTDGHKFLSVLDDGSTQVFYPSGLLAVLLVVTRAHGRVCIVYDESSDRQIRALFQSDGKGTCYHSNGSIWLNLNKHGGQCLDPEGSRVCRWTWHQSGSAPLKPIFFFLNPGVGVRLLGKKQVFVSFLANGKQAKFNVGAWCEKVTVELLTLTLAAAQRGCVLITSFNSSLKIPVWLPECSQKYL